VQPARGAQEACDCPACTGQEIDPAQLLGLLLDDVAPLAEVEDALDAELAGAAFLAMVGAAGDDVFPAFLDAFVPVLESRPGRSSLAVLRALGSVASGAQPQVAEATSSAGDRMSAAGVPEPRWGAELAEPVEVTDCMRLDGGRGGLTALVASFRRAGRGHAFVIVVDEANCAAAADIVLVDADQLPAALDDIRDGFGALGGDVSTQALDPAELRWYAEEALDARAVHDEEDLVDEAIPMVGEDDDDDDDGPPYPVLAQLVRARLAALPEPRKPMGARDHGHPGGPAPTMLDALESILSRATGAPAAGLGVAGLGALRFREPVAKLPAKRKKKDGPAPTYQLKVGLRGAKPPIWRRLLVSADVSLADLHDIVQVAFGWHDSHMHVFETPYGDFGRADRELGHRAEAPVTLEQVAPRAKDKVRYTYDFGDDWEHEILVEKVLDRDPTASALPLCTGGRRAAPPDDCGGIWGYAELVEILADPRNPDHEERLEWLGLDDASQFDPAAFDVDEVNRALIDMR
jgi:hypothetical protein